MEHSDHPAASGVSTTVAPPRPASLATLRRHPAQWALDLLNVSPSLVRYVLAVWALSRLALVTITVVALVALRHIRVTGSFVAAWWRFDATAYTRISANGYTTSASADFAFFPLQPLLTRLATPLALGDSALAGLLVSNAACLVALLGLATLATMLFDEAVARRATLYLILFPTALFLFAGYADALFLAVAIWCVVALHRHAWWQAGVLGLLAALTRQMGLFLLVPFVWEYGRAAQWRLRAVRLDGLAVLLIPGGLLLFMAWLWHAVGDPLAFLHAEGHWAHHATAPWQTLVRAVSQLRQQSDAIFLFRDTVDLAAVVLVAVLILVGSRWLSPGETLFSAAIWLLAICYPSATWALQSDGRYMLLAFPAFLTLARLGGKRWFNVTIIVTFALLMVLMTQYFVRGAIII